ncbi:Fungalysin metallopeptidase-domain-containing protein [Mycena olivaceomarginata]|nr:Fungalysin metallopeptidase-domain-containing protein [Mycena olivaceomarginata]
MVAFNKFFASALFLAIVYASSGLAAPWPASLKHATNRRPRTFGEGIEHPLRKRAEVSIEDWALAFIQAHLDVPADAVSFKCSCAGEVSDHVFVRQAIDGIPVANALTNLAFNKDDKDVVFGSSFDAIASAEQTIDGTFNEHPPMLEFLALEVGSVRFTHVMQIQNAETNTWLEAFVDAHTGDVLSLTDFVTQTSYLVLPTQKEILTPEFQTIFDPQDTLGDPDGWHSDGTTTTTGNNAISFKSATTAPTTTANINAARVNAFHIVNSYGFTEAAFNFQNNNFGKGGARNDRITISVRNSAGIDTCFSSQFYHHAHLGNTSSGQSGAMRMFLWDLTNPERDGALENDIVTYENTHGITNRMTGGRTDRCLQTTEAGGMGEGRSKTTSAVPDYVLGSYVINDPASIRSHPYSTSATVKPLRYSSLRTPTEVWANILHNVYAAFVTAHGFSTTVRTNPAGNEGNIVFLHLFIDALALQPCNPPVLTARTAWIQADTKRYAGANTCALLRAFASRGLGTAAANHVDSTTVPATSAGRLTVAGTLRHHRFANPRLARTPKRANVLLHTPGGPREDAHRRTRAQYALHLPPSLSEFYEDCQRATTFFQRV